MGKLLHLDIMRPVASLARVPVVKQSKFFLEKAAQGAGIRMTRQGQLGREFVQVFWGEHLSSDREVFLKPWRQKDCPEISLLFHLLSETSYVGGRKSAVCPTEKGRGILSGGPLQGLYLDLLEEALDRFNWAWSDVYPAYDFIQEAAGEMIHTLVHWPEESISPRELFEDLREELNGESPARRSMLDPFFSPNENIMRCLKLRFFDRFAVPFGLLHLPSGRTSTANVDQRYALTQFFFKEFPQHLFCPEIS